MPPLLATDGRQPAEAVHQVGQRRDGGRQHLGDARQGGGGVRSGWVIRAREVAAVRNGRWK